MRVLRFPCITLYAGNNAFCHFLQKHYRWTNGRTQPLMTACTRIEHFRCHHCTVQLSPTIYFAGPPPVIGLHHPSPKSVHASPWSIEWCSGPANNQKPQENGANPLKMADNEELKNYNICSLCHHIWKFLLISSYQIIYMDLL